MFINLTNHESKKWSEEQFQAAEALDGTGLGVFDIPFPNIDPNWDKHEIDALAQEYVKVIQDLTAPYLDQFPGGTVFVHLMGETSFVISLFEKIRSFSIVVVSTSERVSVEEVLPDGSTKKSQIFKFVKFRQLR